MWIGQFMVYSMIFTSKYIKSNDYVITYITYGKWYGIYNGCLFENSCKYHEMFGKPMQIRDQTADLIEKYSWDRGHGRLIESRNIPKHGWTIKHMGIYPPVNLQQTMENHNV